MPRSVALQGVSTTCLSWLRSWELPARGLFGVLARLSLLTGVLSPLSGCLVDDPPPYAAPQRTAPRLDYTGANPFLDQVIVTSSGQVVEFSVPVTSEDAGDPLYGIWLLDYGGDGSVPDFLATIPLPASTLDDQKARIFGLKWTVRDEVKPGCHRFTLRATHLSNVSADRPAEAVNKKDLAEAYWFANINVAPQFANSLVDCPQASTRGKSQ